MSREATLMVTARDNYTSTITKMATATRSFEKDMSGLSSKLDLLNKTKAELKVDASKAKSELSAAEKQFKLTGEEADRLDAIAKQSDYNNITSNLKLVSDQARQTEKDMQSLTDELNRQQNRADSGGGSGGEADMLSRIGAAGATKMIGGVASSAISAYASSALGDRGAQALDSVLSSAIEGAAIGSLFGPIGTVVGTLGGAALGGIQAAINDYQVKEDAFKEAVQDIYGTVTTKITEGAASGSELAASREVTRAAFNTLLGGEAEAGEFLAGIQDMANRTPFLYDELTGMSKSLLASGFGAESLMPTLTTLGNAGGVLGMTTSDIDLLAGQLGYMQQSDQVTLQLLKPFVTRGISAFDYLAEAQGVSVEELLANLKDLSGQEAVQTILEGMARDFEGGMDQLASTFSGLTDTVDELWGNIEGAYGESYNSARMEGLNSEMNWLEGPGQGMNEWQSAIGSAHAEYDNTASAVRLGVMDAFMSGDLSGLTAAMGGALTEADEGRLSALAERYAAAMAEGDGFELESLLGIAEAEAETLMASTEIAQAQHDAQLEMISGIQEAEAANNLIADRALEISNKLSQGTASLVNAIQSIPGGNGSITTMGGRGRGMRGSGNAWGQNRVPYDGYITELHEGERVLTAQEARASDSSGGIAPVSVTVMGNLVVREEADLERVAAYLAEQIALAQSVAI